MSPLRQAAPMPVPLAELVLSLVYKPGFTFFLKDMDRGQGSHGLTLVILATVTNSLYPESGITVAHYFIVPAASYNRITWQRWLLDRVIDVEKHEACEFFRIDGERVFAPRHSEGFDPYTIVEYGTDAERDKRSTDV